MGLTADVELALGDASLVTFFDQNRAAFKEIATRSYSFAFDNVTETGLPLRHDDVAKGVVIALVTNEALRECLATKKLREKLWYTRFADLVVERLWEELKNEYKASHA
jgi:hypothetical protein